MSSRLPSQRNGRRGVGLWAGVVGAVVLTLGTTNSLGGFTSSITNTGDKAATGSLLMQEQVTPTGGVTTTCLSTASGATIVAANANGGCTANKFGALTNAVPGATSSSAVVVTNQGSLPAHSFTLGAGACTATPTAAPGAVATNVGSDLAFCGKVDVTIEDDTAAATCVYPAQAGACPVPAAAYNLSTLSAAYSTTPLALANPVLPGAGRTYKVVVAIDATATNPDQAMAATEPLTFTFGS